MRLREVNKEKHGRSQQIQRASEGGQRNRDHTAQQKIGNGWPKPCWAGVIRTVSTAHSTGFPA